MKKLPAILCAMFAFAAAAEDILDTMSKQLNRLEQRYWSAVIMDQGGDFHQETEGLIRETVTAGRQIQNFISRSDYKGVGNITPAVTTLQRVFEEARRRQDKKLRFSFKETSMSAYVRRFRQLQANKGKKVYPNLGNVPLDDYELWLDEVCVDNVKKARKGNSKEALRDNANTRERVGEYFEALKKLRIALVKLRQESGIDFNPPPRVLQ